MLCAGALLHYPAAFQGLGHLLGRLPQVDVYPHRLSHIALIQHFIRRLTEKVRER